MWRRSSFPAWLAVGLACATTAGAEAPAGFDVQGHRGARGLLPENTLVGFERAIELGVTTLEIDVGMSRDGVVVVAHDPWVNPKLCLAPGGERIVGKRGPLLKHLDLREIQAFDCGSLNPDAERFPAPPWRAVPGTRMPTLREVFALARERGAHALHFNVEAKTRPDRKATPPIEPFVAAILADVREAGVLERTTLQAFEWQVLRVAKRHEPQLRTAALLIDVEPRWQAGLRVAEHGNVLGLLRAAAAWVDVFSPYWGMLVEGHERYAGIPVSEYQAAGFPVVPWTVNDRERMRQIVALGVDGLITDYPGRLREVLRERGD